LVLDGVRTNNKKKKKLFAPSNPPKEMGKKEEGAEGKKRQHPLEGMQRALGLQLWSEGIMLGCRSISGL